MKNKRLISATGLAALLAACAPTGEMDAKSKQLIDTFMATCEQGLGDVAKIKSLAEARGFSEQTMFQSLATGDGGFFENKDLGVQVQINVATAHPFECAVTSDDISNPAALGDAFFAATGGTSKTVNGKNYQYKHDTKSGEALVVFSD